MFLYVVFWSRNWQTEVLRAAGLVELRPNRLVVLVTIVLRGRLDALLVAVRLLESQLTLHV
jgi:hypothetical protein